MSEQDPGQLTSDEQAAEIERLRAALAAAGTVPYGEAALTAAEGVQQEEQAAAADTGASLAQMSQDRAEPLPHEAEMDRLMAEFKAMSERVAAMESELGQTRADYAAAAAALGPPAVAVYAKAIHDKLVSLRNAHPDAPAGHFDDVIAAAAGPADAARQVIAGQGHVSDVTGSLEPALAAVDHFVTRTHRRRWGKPIDMSALESDIEDARDAAAAAAARGPRTAAA